MMHESRSYPAAFFTPLCNSYKNMGHVMRKIYEQHLEFCRQL